MSDWWNNSPYTPQDQNPFEPPEEPQESTSAAPEAPQPEVPQQPAEPVPQPTEPAPQVPQQPAMPTPQVPTYTGGWAQPQQTQPQQPQQTQPPQWNVPPQWTPTPPQPSKPPRKKGNGLVIAAVAVLCVLCLCCLGVGAVMLLDKEGGLQKPSIGDSSETSAATSDTPSVVIHDTEVKDGGLSTAEIVKKNLDSTVVVNLYANSVIKYGNFTFGNSEEESLAGTASGIVLSEDGYIITNQHVVMNEKTNEYHQHIEIVLYSGATYRATVVGADEDTDLAVVKINATGLKPAMFGSSENAQLGDRVVTIGNSGGLAWSVSQGILSGTKRDVYDETGYSIQCLQIDAAINPGNSGGPLLNCNGEVIGINSAKIVYDSIENVGFSIPITEAKKIIDDLVANGHVTGRVGLGVTGYTITQSGYEGFMIYTIEPGSALEGTDVQPYDIITKVGGVTVKSRTEVRNALSKYKPGDKVTLTLKRITDQRTGEVTEFTRDITLKEVTN